METNGGTESDRNARLGRRVLRLAFGAVVVGLTMLAVALLMLVAEGIAFRADAGRLALALDASVNLLLGLGAMVGVASLPLFLAAKLLGASRD